jgi:hypothetical protein
MTRLMNTEAVPRLFVKKVRKALLLEVVPHVKTNNILAPRKMAEGEGRCQRTYCYLEDQEDNLKTTIWFQYN